MKPKPRRFVRVDVSQHFKYHLQLFNQLVKLLYPKRESINKYDYLIGKYSVFDASQQELIAKTAHSLTLINEFYRDQDSLGRLYVTREDISNAINLLQRELDLTNRSLLLSPVLRWYAIQLQYKFGHQRFTAGQVANVLGKSKSRIYKVLRELEHRRIIALVDKKHHAHVFELIENIT